MFTIYQEKLCQICLEKKLVRRCDFFSLKVLIQVLNDAIWSGFDRMCHLYLFVLQGCSNVIEYSRNLIWPL